MKLVDLYMMYKDKYNDYVILIKVGNFYETYNDDAYILSNIMKYNVKNYNTYNRVGFPINSMAKIKNVFGDYKINYIIIEKLNVYKVVEIKKFKNNNYMEYRDNCKLSSDINKRIDNICTNLKNCSCDNISDLLSRIESIMYER